jgi:FtsH-binding integral membrane protein
VPAADASALRSWLHSPLLAVRARRFCETIREFVIHTPSLNLLSFFTTFGFLIACHVNKDLHPTNLYCLAGFTLSIASSIGTVCAIYYARGLGLVVLEALALTASVTCGLTVYTLRSKRDVSFMGAGLGASLWVLILGGLVATLTGSASLHFGMAVAGAVIFSLYIVFDVFMISRRLSPDDYIPAAIELYLDIANLFLHLLRILASMQSDR